MKDRKNIILTKEDRNFIENIVSKAIEQLCSDSKKIKKVIRNLKNGTELETIKTDIGEINLIDVEMDTVDVQTLLSLLVREFGTSENDENLEGIINIIEPKADICLY